MFLVDRGDENSWQLGRTKRLANIIRHVSRFLRVVFRERVYNVPRILTRPKYRSKYRATFINLTDSRSL